jgi:4a-hydroxytetrahydrobiopterin dehydratase
MTDLGRRRCRPLSAGSPALDRAAADALLAHTPGWRIDDDGRRIRRLLMQPDYPRTIALVNAIAWIAERADHHPELRVGYDRVEVVYTTHSVGGLSENDFICAARIDALL